MKSRFLTIALAFGLVLVALLPSAALANHTDTCQSPATWRTFIGRSWDPVGSVKAVRANIDVGSWGLCTGATNSDFLYFFVDIGSSNTGCQIDAGCLIQFGIARGPNSGIQYAWAFGGCNGTQPNILHLGSATTTSHSFRIERDALNVFHFFLDGGQLAISISQSDPRIACWATGDRGADWLMEKSDFGNGFGEEASKSQFDAVSYKVSSWTSVPSSSTCYDGESNDFCTDFADGDFDGWTDNGGTLAETNPHDIVFNAPSADWVGVPWR